MMRLPSCPAWLPALLLICAPFCATAAETKVAERWAVLIGVDDYANANDLQYCGADQTALRDRLITAGFRPENVILLHDKASDNKYRPSRGNIEQQLRLVINSAEANDLLVVGFSGHGVSLAGKSYLCPGDATLSDPTTLVSLDGIYDQLRNCAARFKWVLVDACRNDPNLGGGRSLSATDGTKQLARSLREIKLPEGVVLLNSCAPGEISWEEEKFGHGVYMNYVLEAMSGAGDADGDGAVSLNELQRYASGRTKSYVIGKFNQTQRPFSRSEGEAEAMDFALLPVRAGGAVPLSEAEMTERRAIARRILREDLGVTDRPSEKNNSIAWIYALLGDEKGTKDFIELPTHEEPNQDSAKKDEVKDWTGSARILGTLRKRSVHADISKELTQLSTFVSAEQQPEIAQALAAADQFGILDSIAAQEAAVELMVNKKADIYSATAILMSSARHFALEYPREKMKRLSLCLQDIDEDESSSKFIFAAFAEDLPTVDKLPSKKFAWTHSCFGIAPFVLRGDLFTARRLIQEIKQNASTQYLAANAVAVNTLLDLGRYDEARSWLASIDPLEYLILPAGGIMDWQGCRLGNSRLELEQNMTGIDGSFPLQIFPPYVLGRLSEEQRFRDLSKQIKDNPYGWTAEEQRREAWFQFLEGLLIDCSSSRKLAGF